MMVLILLGFYFAICLGVIVFNCGETLFLRLWGYRRERQKQALRR